MLKLFVQNEKNFAYFRLEKFIEFVGGIRNETKVKSEHLRQIAKGLNDKTIFPLFVKDEKSASDEIRQWFVSS